MSISTRHSAAAPAAGFEQQRRLGLVLLAEAYPQERLKRAWKFALPRTQTARFFGGTFCSSFRDEFDSESLVAHRELEVDPTEDEKEPYRKRPFVRQLEVVDAGPDVVDLAIRMYE